MQQLGNLDDQLLGATIVGGLSLAGWYISQNTTGLPPI